MKISTKRSIAAASAFVLAAAFQWVSGMPFERSPGEAYFLLMALIFSAWMAAYPGFSE